MKRTLDERRIITEYYDRHGSKKTMKKYSLTKCQVKEVARWYRKNRKKHRDSYTPERLNHLRLAAMKYARLRGHPEEVSQDFGSFVTMKALQGRKITLKNLYADFVKEVFGHSRGAKNGVMRATVALEDGLMAPASGTGDTDPEADFDSLLDTLKVKGIHRSILKLKFKYNLGESEIADALELPGSRVVNILQDEVLRMGKIYSEV